MMFAVVTRKRSVPRMGEVLGMAESVEDMREQNWTTPGADDSSRRGRACKLV
jgi:hypothetical protein